jgi:site-specific recombinase XerD
VTAIRKSEDGAAGYGPHLSVADVKLLAMVAAEQKRTSERNRLLIKTLFDGALRCSESISIRPADIQQDNNGWSVSILGSQAFRIVTEALKKAGVPTYGGH